MNIGTVVKFKVQLADGWFSGHGTIESQSAVAGRTFYGIKVVAFQERGRRQTVAPFYNGDAVVLEKQGVVWRVGHSRFIAALANELEVLQ